MRTRSISGQARLGIWPEHILTLPESWCDGQNDEEDARQQRRFGPCKLADRRHPGLLLIPLRQIRDPLIHVLLLIDVYWPRDRCRKYKRANVTVSASPEPKTLSDVPSGILL